MGRHCTLEQVLADLMPILDQPWVLLKEKVDFGGSVLGGARRPQKLKRLLAIVQLVLHLHRKELNGTCPFWLFQAPLQCFIFIIICSGNVPLFIHYRKIVVIGCCS